MKDELALLFFIVSAVLALWASIILITGMDYFSETITLSVLFYLAYKSEANNK